MATSFLPATVLRSSGEWPFTSALGLLTRKYSALTSNVSPLSKAMISALRSLCNRSSVGQGCDAALLISILRCSIGPLWGRLDVKVDHAAPPPLHHRHALDTLRPHPGPA